MRQMVEVRGEKFMAIEPKTEEEWCAEFTGQFIDMQTLRLLGLIRVPTDLERFDKRWGNVTCPDHRTNIERAINFGRELERDGQ